MRVDKADPFSNESGLQIIDTCHINTLYDMYVLCSTHYVYSSKVLNHIHALLTHHNIYICHIRCVLMYTNKYYIGRGVNPNSVILVSHYSKTSIYGFTPLPLSCYAYFLNTSLEDFMYCTCTSHSSSNTDTPL